MPLLRELRDRLNAALDRGAAAGLSREELANPARCRRSIQSAIDDRRGKVRICCRIRPLSEEERAQGLKPCVRAVDDTTLEVQGGGVFKFNSVFAPGTQEEVFEDARDLVHAAIDGRNVTILSYGPTGAGKTHTLFGSPTREEHDDDGIAFQAGAELFKAIDGHRHHADVSVSVSMMELYNNSLSDLLGRRAGRIQVNTEHALRLDVDGALSVEGIEEEAVHDAAEFRRVLERGLAHRAVAAHALNAHSSRSHFLLTAKVERVDRETGRRTRGKIVICDLAGSERLKRTRPVGEQQREAIEINKSLTALGDVIKSVATGQKSVPYRNHKLTRLLQDSLGGSARTLMVVSCSPSASCAGETLVALKYAARVHKVTNSSSAEVVDDRP